jgi:heme oxygenase (biliverdin-IX-beta and delta-forming)
MSIQTDELRRPGRVSRMKAETGEEHDRLDRRIMDGRPFESRERYGLFLKVQHGFHTAVDAAYRDPRLNALLPHLLERARLHEVEQDLADLGLRPDPSRADRALEPPEALGWLYVAEGSNLGAAFLLKEAAKLGLSAEFGARHLAPHADGRGLSWRRFTADMDAVQLTSDEDARALEGARAAFRHVHQLVHDRL